MAIFCYRKGTKLMEEHVTMRDIARILSPANPAPAEVIAHLEACPRCLRLFDGLTQSEERMDILSMEAEPCPHEPEVYNLYFGIDKIPQGTKEKIKRAFGRSKLIRHISECEYCTRYVQFLRMSASLPDPLALPVRETAQILAGEASRVCFDFLSVLMGLVPQPQLQTMYMAANTDKKFIFEFPLANMNATLTYTMDSGTLAVARPAADRYPPITVIADGEKRADGANDGWSEVTDESLICRFSTGQVNLLCVAGCPVIETVPYIALRDQKKVLDNLAV